MKKIALAPFLFLLLINCSPESSKFDPMDHNQLVTKIHIPEDYKLIASVDTDFIRITIIDLDKKNCTEFYKENKFEPVGDSLPQTLIGMNYLDSIYRQLPPDNKLLSLSGKAKFTNWIYLLDTTTCRLYCHLSFPDWNGHTK